jgi:trehalose utilization protein
MVWKLGKGRVLCFRPGHETFTLFKQKPVLQLLEYAVRWLPSTQA